MNIIEITNKSTTDKNAVLVYLSISCLFSSLLIVSNVRADDVCESDYPDQFLFDDCEGVTPLEWVNFPQTRVSLDSETLISVSGGKATFTWSVTGKNFYLDRIDKAKTEESSHNNETIYAVDACGTATVTVTDGCSSVSGVVVSTAGRWVEKDFVGCIDGDPERLYSWGNLIYWRIQNPTQQLKITTNWDGTVGWKPLEWDNCTETEQTPSYEEAVDMCESGGDAECTHTGIGILPYCVESVDPECMKGTLSSLYPGYCPWNIDGFVSCSVASRRQSAVTYWEWECQI